MLKTGSKPQTVVWSSIGENKLVSGWTQHLLLLCGQWEVLLGGEIQRLPPLIQRTGNKMCGQVSVILFVDRKWWVEINFQLYTFRNVDQCDADLSSAEFSRFTIMLLPTLKWIDVIFGTGQIPYYHKYYILSLLIDSLWHFTWCRYPPNSSANDLLNPPCSCSVGTQICPDNSFYPPVKQRMVITLILYRISGDNN